MALTQMQQIQSLGEALAWLEREISWGVPVTELRHLCGRIGELYACTITNGQMALKVNQRGYDVVSADGERISVKTTGTSHGGMVNFNANTLDLVDRVIILRVNTEEMQVEILLDVKIDEARAVMREGAGKVLSINLAKLERPRSSGTVEISVRTAAIDGFVVTELESGTIEVRELGTLRVPAKPALRALAGKLGLSLINGRGNPYNTRQLGSMVIEAVNTLSESTNTFDSFK